MDSLIAPTCDTEWGHIGGTHRAMLRRFLGRCPPACTIPRRRLRKVQGGCHDYPAMMQVRHWVEEAGFELRPRGATPRSPRRRRVGGTGNGQPLGAHRRMACAPIAWQRDRTTSVPVVDGPGDARCAEARSGHRWSQYGYAVDRRRRSPPTPANLRRNTLAPPATPHRSGRRATTRFRQAGVTRELRALPEVWRGWAVELGQIGRSHGVVFSGGRCVVVLDVF
jgi:hypothetical protein